MNRILVTGSEGLIGKSLSAALEATGHGVERLDLRCAVPSDIRDKECIRAKIAGCRGVVHLAAVSRVAWGERDPGHCWQVNAEGTRNVLACAEAAPERPWVLVTSSREVYGEAQTLQLHEDSPIRPMNVYGRSKAASEAHAEESRARGLCTAVVRFSNVYGSIDDHPDRVVPAFASSAAAGGVLRVCGSDHVFDFTHLSDTIRGVLAMVGALEGGAQALPPIHLVTGRATSLGELAQIANQAAGGRGRIIEMPSRNYDVSRFVGDGTRARNLLNWRPEIDIKDGVYQLVHAFRHASQAAVPLSRVGR
jgi:nucleoside-diphosphate-sugar epimerase